METTPSLLQRYRRDRRKLLKFLLSPSAGYIKELRNSTAGSISLSSIDFDTLSVDYILHSIHQSNGILNISEATRRFTEEARYPVTMDSELGDTYFLVSDPESAGSPPRRAPPPVVANHPSISDLHQSNPHDSLIAQNISVPSNEFKNKYAATQQKLKPLNRVLSLGLPALHTGLSDDDLRESAYEILLTCMAFYGLEIYSFEDQKKDKSSGFLAGLKNKRDKKHLQPQPQSPERHEEVINTIRVQMQISEAMDACVRQTSMQFASRKACGQLDIPQISLGLLNGILKSDFLYEKPYMQWKKRQANILEEVLISANHLITDKQVIETLLAKINNSEEWDNLMSTSERTEVLAAIRQVSLLLSSVNGHFGIQGETCYWATSYHFNIRLYEKLLFGIFDILDEGNFIEGADEFMKLCKLTWSTLGITQKVHNALYGWVLFQQFVLTEEEMLLDHAIIEVQKLLSTESSKGKDEEYINSLICYPECDDSEPEMNLVQAILWSMSYWCGSKLQDYHLHFSQEHGFFAKMLTMALVLGNKNYGSRDENKLTSDALSGPDAVHVKMYVERSVEAAYRRIENTIILESQMERSNALAVLANDVRVIAEKELNVYSPVLCHWYPESAMVAAKLLHQLYGERLKPFLEQVSSLSDEVKLVLPAVGRLERGLSLLFSSTCKEKESQSFSILELDRYQLGKFSRPIILEWVIAQHARILEWTGRALDLEKWEPLSHQQKHSSSAVEVFRIIEETVDQLFALSLPLDITHLQALLSIIFHTLDSYLHKVCSRLVDKHHLYPPVPPLTRYKETVFPVIKKKVVENVLLEEEVNSNLAELTVSKLCIRLNTLQYIQKQMGILEDGIRKSWGSATLSENNRGEEHPEASETVLEYSESVDELFVATFDSLRDTAADAIRRTCEFIGARVVFWDLRDSFLFRLYRGSVESARFETILPNFDSVLNNICGYVDDILRDLVVASICKASLDGYVWVLLDGGPSCAFSDADVKLMDEDLHILKDFFIADGEGLPRSLVENEAQFAHQILNLFSLQTESVIQMLMTASELIPTGVESQKHGHRHVVDARTLVRVLCHKKDKEASQFLKLHYHLPASSDYDDESPLKDSGLKPPMMTDFIRTTSLQWSNNGHDSFKSIKKRLQKVTSEIRHSGSSSHS
ncbi:hypothetical protein AgCh_023473 [Apium graveolens]